MSQQVLGRNLAQKSQNSKMLKKNSWKFVYILAKECRSPFNLTNFFDKNFKILISRRFEIFTKTCLDTLYMLKNETFWMIFTHCVLLPNHSTKKSTLNLKPPTDISTDWIYLMETYMNSRIFPFSASFIKGQKDAVFLPLIHFPSRKGAVKK